jgi:hypothetical protein
MQPMKRISIIAVVLLACGAAAWPGAGWAGQLAGSYGFTFSGTVNMASGFTGPIVGVGTFLLDGRGNVTGQETFNVTGTLCSGSLAGTYTTSRAGVGTVTATFTATTSDCPTPSASLDLIYTSVNNNNKLYLLQSGTGSSNKIVSGVAEKQEAETH